MTEDDDALNVIHARTSRSPKKKKVPETTTETAVALYGKNAVDLATVDRGKASANVDAGANAINKLNA